MSAQGPRRSLAVRTLAGGWSHFLRWEIHALVGAWGVLLAAEIALGVRELAFPDLFKVVIALLAGALGAGESRPLRILASRRGMLSAISVIGILLLLVAGNLLRYPDVPSERAAHEWMQACLVLAAVGVAVPPLLRSRGLTPPPVLQPILASLLLAGGVALPVASIFVVGQRYPGAFTSLPPPLDFLGWRGPVLCLNMAIAYLNALMALLLGRWMLLAAGGRDPRWDEEPGED